MIYENPHQILFYEEECSSTIESIDYVSRVADINCKKCDVIFNKNSNDIVSYMMRII